MPLDKSSKNARLKLKHDLEIGGYTLTDVSELADVSLQAVSQYIHGFIFDSPRIETAIQKLLLRRKAA